MKRIKNYLTYLLESIFYVEDDLIKILSNIKSPVAEVILNLVGNDIKINFNRLKLTDKNSLIEFLPDSKINGDPDWSLKGNQAKVGRLFKDILISNGHSEFSDKDIEDFVNKFKSAYDTKDNLSKLNIKIVRGEDIIKYYDAENYKYFDGGTLNNSCMRHKKCAKYFGIYKENPDVCGLVVYLDNDDLVIARSIFWKLNYSNRDFEFYLDRIYYNNIEDSETLKSWVIEHNKDKKIGFYQGSPGSLSVKLKNFDFDKYPYMDTFANLDYDILNNQGEGSKTLQQTDGSFSDDSVWCEMEGESYHEDEVIYLHDRDISCHSDNARYSEYRGQWYWYEDVVSSRYHDHDYIPNDIAVYSAHLDDYLINDKANLVYLNEDKTKEDYYPLDELDEEYGEYDGDYYKMSLLIETDDGFTLKSRALYSYKDVNEDEYYTKIDALIYSKEIDDSKETIFDIDEYNSDLYFHKHFKTEMDFINKRIEELGIEISKEESDKKVKEYTDWHNKKMSQEGRYYSRQKIYEFGSYAKFIEEKRKYIVSKIDEEIDEDCIKKAIDYSILINEIDISRKNLPKYCLDVKYMFNLLYEYIDLGIRILKFDDSNIKYSVLHNYDYDIRHFLSGFVFKITSFLNDQSKRSTSAFMNWNDEKWIEFCKISGNLFTEDTQIGN